MPNYNSAGWQAVTLNMPDRIPRTEYSAEFHWPLVRRVTGLNVSGDSTDQERSAASVAFMKAWGYDFIWSTLISEGELGDIKTDMGHAIYVEGGADYRAVGKPLLGEPDEVYAFDFDAVFVKPDKEALIKRFESHYRANEARMPDAVNMTGVYITMVSGLIALLGWEALLTAAGTDYKRFGAFAERYAGFIAPYYEALAAADVPCVMAHDDIVWSSGAFLPPDWYRTFIFPQYKRFFAPLLDSGKKVMYTSDGDFTAFAGDIAACGVSGFVMEPLTDLRYMAERFGKTHVLIGNADTRILLTGNREAIEAEVRRCMDIGRGLPGFIMAVGNHIPPNTPVESCLWYNECYGRMSRR